ncbi:hypothetical protein JCM6882_006286 [Rhodosporidiobolus microsporus]
MAKGLFAVYRDPGVPSSTAAPSSRSSSTHNNPSASSRRRDGLDSCSSSSVRTAKLREKENVDPFKRYEAGLAGKGGKKAALGAKKLVGDESSSCAGKAGRTATTGVNGKAKPSLNGICTGTLRTKVLPDSVFSDAPPAQQVDAAPQVIEIYPSSSTSSPRVSGGWDRSPSSSAADSGYARSLSGKASDSDLDAGNGARRLGDESDGEGELSDYEANRRARALTESPLAEITQAFTGLGGFSAANANMSPSPSPAQHAFPLSARPPPPTRTRSSPSKTSLSALPPRMQPYAYSTTATTKRVKPGQAAAGAPRAAPTARTLRF